MQNEKKQKKRPKKKALRKQSKTAVVMKSEPGIYDRKVLSYPTSMVGTNFDSDVCHRFDQLAPRMVGGRSIERYYGRAPLATIVEFSTTTVGSGCLVPLVGGGNTEVLHLNPLYLFPSSSPEGKVMAAYTKYRFTKLKLLYQGLRQANTNGTVVLGYYNDGALQNTDVTSSSALYTPGCIITNLWNPVKVADVTRYLTGGDWFYMDYDTNLTAADADWRLSFQGALFGVWYLLTDTLPGLGLEFDCGQLWIEYELELNGPRYAYDIVLMDRLKPVVERLIRKHNSIAKAKMVDARASLLDPLQDPQAESSIQSGSGLEGPESGLLKPRKPDDVKQRRR